MRARRWLSHLCKTRGSSFWTRLCVYLYIHRKHLPPGPSTSWLERCPPSQHLGGARGPWGKREEPRKPAVWASPSGPPDRSFGAASSTSSGRGAATHRPRPPSPAPLAVRSCHRVTGPLLGAGGGPCLAEASGRPPRTCPSPCLAFVFTPFCLPGDRPECTAWPSRLGWVSLFSASPPRWLGKGAPGDRRDCGTALATFCWGRRSVVRTGELSRSSLKPPAPRSPAAVHEDEIRLLAGASAPPCLSEPTSWVTFATESYSFSYFSPLRSP